MRKTPISFRKRLLFGALISLLSAAFAFSLVEAYVRLTRPKKDIYVLTGRIPGPNPASEWAFVDAFSAFRPKPGQYAVGKTISAQGFFATPEITLAKPKGTIRIMFLGGSATAGTGKDLTDPETWPWQTVEMVRKRVHSRVDFINAAVPGYSLFESFGRLWSRIRYFEPDIVVVCHGWNEMYYFEKADDILSWRTLPDGSWSHLTTAKPFATYSPHRIDPLIRWSQALTRIRMRYSRPLGWEVGPLTSEPLKSDYNHSGLSIYRTNLKLLREACAVMGMKLFVAKQPTLIVPNLPPEERKRCRYERHGFDHDAHVDAFREIYDVMDQEFPGSSVIDLTPISGRPECFFDHIHPTPTGCLEIATVVSEWLIAYIQEIADSQPTGP